MAHMLAMVVNALQSNRDQQLPRVEFAYNNSVRAATGLAPNVVHIGWRPRIHLTIFERTGIVGHQSLAGDHLAYCDVATDRQQGASDIVREHHALTVSLAWNATTQPSLTHCARFPKSPFAVGCEYAIRLPPSAKARRRTRTPRSSTPSSRSTGWTPTVSSQLALLPPPTPRTALPWVLSSYILDLPSDMPGSDVVGAFRYNASSPAPTPTTMAWRNTEVLTSRVDAIRAQQFLEDSTPYHVTQEDVSTPPQRFEQEKITGHQSVRGRGGIITVMYETDWAGLCKPSWERELKPPPFLPRDMALLGRHSESTPPN